MTETQRAPEAGAEITNEERRIASCKVARQLRNELNDIDQQIRQVELQAGAEPDQESETVKALLSRRDALRARRELLPGLLCGARGSALKAAAACLQASADREVRPLLEAAAVEHEQASVALAEATAALQSAQARLAEAERQHTQHEREYQNRGGEIARYLYDAGLAEQGLALSAPERFDGLAEWSAVVSPVTAK